MTIENDDPNAGGADPDLEAVQEGGEAAGGAEQDEQQQTQGAESEIEIRARKFGWRPKEEFRGNPDEWRSAEEFIEYGEKTNPILRQNISRVEKENEALRKQLADVQKTAKEFSEFQSGIEQRAYERAVAEIKARQRQAVTDSDGAAFEQAENDLAELAKQKPKPKVQEQQPAIDPVVARWNQDHTWYGQDEAMTIYANVQAQKMAKENPELLKDKDAFLGEMVSRVKKEFAHKFTPPQVRRGNSVEGSSNGGGAGGGAASGKRTYANLPADAKAQCDKFIQQGYIKNREEYAKYYQWDA